MSAVRISPLLDKTPGAKWWRVDFHTHTPFSFDAYNSEKSVSARQWLLAHMKMGIDAVVISDHNGGGWIDILKKECIQLESELCDEYRPLIIFPGVEITTSQNVHILVILDPSASEAEISRILQIARYRGREGDHNAAAEQGIVPFIEDIQSQGISCLVIPAHVNGAKGILDPSVPFDTRKKALAHSMIFSLECHHSKAAEWDLNEFVLGDKTFAVVYGSDSHELKDIGRSTSWVRMGSPSLDGLRVALLDGKNSVRKFHSDQDPGPHSPYYIQCIRIAGTKYIGRKEEQEIKLNPSFNAIIGGRGTGKSSILELVRASTKRNTIFSSSKSDYARNHIELVDEITANLPKNTSDLEPKVEVDYRQHGKTFRMRWLVNPQTYQLYSLEDNGAEIPVADEGVWSDRFPMRIFSQKQLYAFKEHTGPLLIEIDATPQVDGSAWQKGWANSLAEFIQLSAKIQQLEIELAEKDDLKAKIADIERRIGIMEAAGHKKVLRELSLRRRQYNELERWKEEVRELPSAFADLAYQIQIKKLLLSRLPYENEDKMDSDDSIEKNIETKSHQICDFLNTQAEFLRSAANKLQAEYEAFESAIESSSWKITRDQSEKSYLDLLNQLREEKTQPEQYGEIVQLRQIMKNRLHVFEGKEVEHKNLKILRIKEFNDLENRRKAISNKRKDFLESLFSSSNNIKTDLIPCGDIQEGIALLRQILGRDGNVAAEEFEAISTYLLESNSEENRIQRIKELKLFLWKIARGVKDAETNPLIKIGKRFTDHMRNRTTEERARMLAWFPPDLLKIRYKKQTTGKFADLEKGSPGQVAAAVLAFLLAYGEEPILLDQPEDDLDNRLIYDLIVKEIQNNKIRRQLLIITHNPNIVVNGNADLVIPLEEKNGRSEIPLTGALDNPIICKAVCDIMEGGKEALERRFRRIAY